jgi:hypothetical protein
VLCAARGYMSMRVASGKVISLPPIPGVAHLLLFTTYV